MIIDLFKLEAVKKLIPRAFKKWWEWKYVLMQYDSAAFYVYKRYKQACDTMLSFDIEKKMRRYYNMVTR